MTNARTNHSRQHSREFMLGMIVAAWHLQHAHGQDTYAEELIAMAGPIGFMQRLAKAEDYQFKRGFWAALKARSARA